MFKLLKTGLKRLKHTFAKTRSILGDKIRCQINGPISESELEHLEQVLYESDLGSSLSTEFVEYVRGYGHKYTSFTEAIKAHAKNILYTKPCASPKNVKNPPKVILVVGTNGSGKTTTCAKLSSIYNSSGQSTLLAAGDTFRAAAIDQLVHWSKKLNVNCIRGVPGSDPSAVVHDALTAAKAREYNNIVIDTAGRLQSKTDLMKELEKISSVIKKFDADAPHEVYLVLDATTGQNAIDQAKIFNKYTPLTGLILTKLDGSTKGGIILPIFKELGIPISYIGIGEGINDLVPFSIDDYLDALFS